MNRNSFPGRIARWMAGAAGVGFAAYAMYAAAAWYRYGRATPPTREQSDVLLDRFMPRYDVAERHQIRISAPPGVVLAAAAEMDFQRSAMVRAIFKGRERIMRSHTRRDDVPRQFLAQMQTIGWGELAHLPGHEVVMGATAQPWQADVVFRPLAPERFAEFCEPGYVKIVWTLRADAVAPRESIFRTETRVVATDPVSRAKFRRYWAFASPGIILIRYFILGPLKADAEWRARVAK
jgi:hypothetical protein